VQGVAHRGQRGKTLIVRGRVFRTESDWGFLARHKKPRKVAAHPRKINAGRDRRSSSSVVLVLVLDARIKRVDGAGFRDPETLAFLKD
jgi:hypothetical protein